MGSLGRISPESLDIALKTTGQAMFEMALGEGNQSISWSNRGVAQQLFGLAQNADLDSSATVFAGLSENEAALRTTAIEASRDNQSSYLVEYLAETPHGPTWLEERGAVHSMDGQDRLIATVRCIDAQKSREEHLEYLATYDELTGQLNRIQFKQVIGNTIDHLRVNAGKSVTMLVGIDGVGKINSDFGFEVADQVIMDVAERIVSVLGDKGVCGRVAGTKFGILLQDGSSENILGVARTIMNKMREKVVRTSSGSIGVSVCIGATILHPTTDSAGIAMSQAEAAFDQARRKGPSSFEMFSENTETVAHRHRNTQMADTILGALNDRRLYLAYQPIVSDVNANHTKYECLVRMRGEDGQEIPAPSFVPTAERLGLVHLLDRRVLELATQTLMHIPGIALNVNLSWETVKDPVWAEGYLSHLRASRRVTDRLTIELTETQVVDTIDASVEFVSAIKELGCKFAIDDFGAGYTSFRNLKALDIDVLKIDGSFISGVSNSRENQLFVRTLLDLARNFSMKTVAEWVDNEADATLLKALGVDYLQGYYIGKPEAHPEWDVSYSPNAQMAG